MRGVKEDSCRTLYCQGCGKIIGKVEDRTVKIQHKGRIVSFHAADHGICLKITCETCKTENCFEK